MSDTATTGRRPFSSPLWHSPGFTLLLSGQVFAQFGIYVSGVVVPLLAIETLHAGPTELGVISLMGKLAAVLYLVAGVWVDRMRKRRVLVTTNLIRGALLLLIPVEWALGILSVPLLGLTMFAATALTVWFDTAYMSYLPSIVDRDRLTMANSRMESARAAGQVTGPSIGGLLVQAVTAPVAVVVDGLGMLASALLIARIRRPEPKPTAPPRGLRGLKDDLVEGLRFVGGNPMLRSLAVAIAVSNIAWAAETALYVVYLVDVLGLSPALVGLTLIGSGPGALVGALAATGVSSRFGRSTAIVCGLAVFFLGALLIPLSPGIVGVALPVLIVAGFLMAAGGQVCSVNVISLRQASTPDHLQGRVNGSFRFLAYGLAPLGALAGGVAGTLLGARIALFIAVGLMAVPPLMVQYSVARKRAPR